MWRRWSSRNHQVADYQENMAQSAFPINQILVVVKTNTKEYVRIDISINTMTPIISCENLSQLTTFSQKKNSRSRSTRSDIERENRYAIASPQIKTTKVILPPPKILEHQSIRPSLRRENAVFFFTRRKRHANAARFPALTN